MVAATAISGRIVIIRALWGAIGVNAIALLYIPGHAASFRLLKWGVWGIVLSTLAVISCFSGAGRSSRLMPGERRIFMVAGGLVMWSVLAPLISTPFTTAHTAGILQLCMGFSFSWLVALELSDADQKTRCGSLFVLGVGGAILSVIVLLQATGLTLPGFIPAQSVEFQAPGTLGNPNWTAAFLLPLVPILLGVRNKFSTGDGKRFPGSVCLGMAVLIAAATLATRSKAGAIALIAGIVVYVIFNPKLNRRIRLSMIIGLSTAISVLLAWLVSSGLLQSLVWTRGRLFLWKACLILIAQHPITGYGLGGFLPAYPEALPQLLNGDPLAYMPLHRIEFAYNDFLQMAVDAGLPAALLFLALVFLLLHRAFRNSDSLSRGVGAAIASMALYGCCDSPLQLTGTLALWWFLVGWMMAGRMPDHGKQDGITKQRWLYRVVFVSFIALLGIFQAIRFCAADSFWTRGIIALRVNEYHHASEMMQAAAAFAPENAKLLSESAKTSLLDRNPNQALQTANLALLAGFSFDDLFLRQRVIKQMKGADATFDEWRRMASDYPGLFTPHIELARFYLKQDDLASARAELETVLQIRQSDDIDRTYKIEANRMLELILARISVRR